MDNQWIRNLAATYGQVKQKQMEEAATTSTEETVDESSIAATRKALAKVSATSKKGIKKVTLAKAPWDKKGMTEAEVEEGKRGFILAAKTAKEKGEKTFVFAGKTYQCENYNLDEASIDEASIDEASKTIDTIMQIVDKKQAMKIDGVMVDMFTASAIAQIYNKVNDANKAKMDKMKATQLANVAMKLLQKENVNELTIADVQKGTAMAKKRQEKERKAGKKSVSTADLAARMPKKEAADDGKSLDKVDPKAAKKKFQDRKDKDIDNDGDVDSSDEYLHKRRKAITKAMDEEREVCPKCKGEGCEHCDNTGYHKVSETKNEDTDSATLVCKECGDEFNKPVSEDCSYDSGDKNGSNWITKSNTNESVQEAAKPESNDVTRDSWQKQLQTRKGEADFVNKHTIETPEYADGPAVNTKTFQSFLSGVNGPTMRPGDNSAGDKTVINPPKK